jgi:hypothetical protein
MTLSPEQIDWVLERTAQLLAERVEERVGSMGDMAVFPLSTVSQLVGLSTKQIPVYLPVTKTAEGKHGVTIGAIRKHIESRTEQPRGLARRKGAAA